MKKKIKRLKDERVLAKTFLSEMLGNTKTSKKKIKNCSRGHCKLQRKSERNFITAVLKDSKEFSGKHAW